MYLCRSIWPDAAMPEKQNINILDQIFLGQEHKHLL